jgi:hypothetical protein
MWERFERVAPTKLIVVGCAAFFGACGCAYSQQPGEFVPPPPPPVFNPSSPYTVPQPSYKPVSPATPSILPGSGANSRLDVSPLPSTVTHSQRRVTQTRQVRTFHHRTFHHPRRGTVVVGSAAGSYYYSLLDDGYGCAWRRSWDGYWFRTAPCF